MFTCHDVRFNYERGMYVHRNRAHRVARRFFCENGEIRDTFRTSRRTRYARVVAMRARSPRVVVVASHSRNDATMRDAFVEQVEMFRYAIAECRAIARHNSAFRDDAERIAELCDDAERAFSAQCWNATHNACDMIARIARDSDVRILARVAIGTNAHAERIFVARARRYIVTIA